MTVGERIKQKRLELQWSQEELAKKAGYNDKTAISKLEHAGNNISLKQTKRIADAMSIDYFDLLGWVDIEVKEPDKSFEKRILTYYELLNKIQIQKLLNVAKESEDADIEMATQFLERLRGKKDDKNIQDS